MKKHVVTYFDNEKGGNKSPNPDGERKHFS